MLLADTWCPRKSSWVALNRHLTPLAAEHLPQMDLVFLFFSAADQDVIHVAKSTIFTRENMVMRPCKVLPAFLIPNVILVYSKRPNGVVIAVFGMSSWFIWILWYPLKTLQPAMWEVKSILLGSG